MNKFIFAATTLSLLISIAGCSGNPAGADNAPNTQDKAPIADTAPAEKSGESDTTPKTPTESEEDAPEAAPTEIIGIPGNYMGDVLAALNQTTNLPIGAISPASDHDGYYTSSQVDVPELGVSFQYSISCDTEYQITLATFDFIGDADNAEYRELGKGFISYCSSLYYDTADADAAQTWVAENFPNIADAPETTIGDAYFRMENTGDIFTLTVKVKDYDEQSTALAR